MSVSATPRNHRFAGRLVAGAGATVGALGAASVVVGGALPWARFAVFGVPLALPGLLTWGALTAGLGLLALTHARRWPLAGVLLGVASLAAGATAGRTVGRSVVATQLRIERALAPVNARLAEATLPPVEPFGSIRPSATYVGPGPTWTIWGGAALAFGSACRFAGGRLRRTCASCGTVWADDRADGVVYCPRCGTQAGPVTDCAVCRAPLRKADRFCWRCGTAATRTTPPTKGDEKPAASGTPPAPPA